MITRPLELAAQMRQPPRSFDALFYVNVGLLVLFFTLFGSAFVIGPGVGVDFELPQAAGAARNQIPFTHTVTVVNAGLIFADDGRRTLDELRQWLRVQAQTAKDPSLQIMADVHVPASLLLTISGDARAAGFGRIQLTGTEPRTPASSFGK